MVGSSILSGFDEGVGNSARFSVIPGFVQINETSVIATDRNNHCLRFVDRTMNLTSVFAGQYKSSGFSNGADARFSFPYETIKDTRVPNRLLLPEQGNKAICAVNIMTRLTTTLTSSGLVSPVAISFNNSHKNLLILDNSWVKHYDFDSQTVSVLTGSGIDSFADSPLSVAKFNDPACEQRSLIIQHQPLGRYMQQQSQSDQPGGRHHGVGLHRISGNYKWNGRHPHTPQPAR